ncbi:hypothetical protein PInf_005186 [Phytophthora infestans]|nr:hypothetical protein PInf_005186 [Phytophthora infestans]
MVAPAGKQPRNKLTEEKRRLCQEAFLSSRHARRFRRAEQKEDVARPVKKAVRKEVAEYAVYEETEAEAKEAAGATDEAKEAAEVLADIVASTVASDAEVTTQESASDEESLGDDPMPSPAPLMECIVNGDANLMASGAAQCTGLNSDEYTSLQDGQESEYGDDDDDWVEDWAIGELTDGDAEGETVSLPESECLSAARDKQRISKMRADGSYKV